MFSSRSLLLLLLAPLAAQAFSVAPTTAPTTTALFASPSAESTKMMVALPPSNSGLQAEMTIEPILDVPSEFIEVRYKLPFGLDVAPQNNLAVCTKDGPGGEKVGDVLRYTSQWQIGLPRGDGLVSTFGGFSGAASWQCSFFNVMKAGSWEQVVEALTSNVAERTDEVALIFERPLPQE